MKIRNKSYPVLQKVISTVLSNIMSPVIMRLTTESLVRGRRLRRKTSSCTDFLSTVTAKKGNEWAGEKFID